MSVVFVHGVANRDDDPSYKPHLKEITDFLNRYVGNDISPSGAVLEAYWGKFGAAFAWNRESRPKSVLFRQGAPTTSSDVDRALVMASADGSHVPAAPPNPQDSSVLVPAGPTVGRIAIGSGIRLKDLSPQELSDLLSTVIVETNADPGVRPLPIIAADEVAYDPATPCGTSSLAGFGWPLRLQTQNADVPADRDKRWFYAEKAPGQGQGVIGQRSIYEGSCQPRLLLRHSQAISIRPEHLPRGVPKPAYPFDDSFL
jgi:hypothetical protein